ncbi:hypothetical protein BY458DRAFT_527379 [Sporodiniella umbellata]|nr:hypothetical protein BY458DRAFT_527379 [Sporodiniella umbellata]
MVSIGMLCVPEEIKRAVFDLLSQKDAYHCLLAHRKFYASALHKLWETAHLTTPQAIDSFRHGLQSPALPGQYVRQLTVVSLDPDRVQNFVQCFQLLPNLSYLELHVPKLRLEETFSGFYETHSLLSHCKIDTEHMSSPLLLSLGECKTIKTLELGFNGKRCGDLRLLVNMAIESLTLTGCCAEVYSQALHSIAPIKSLKALCIKTTKDCLDGFAPLFPDNCLFKLESLSLDYFKVNASLLAFLSKQVALKEYSSSYLHFPINSLHYLTGVLPETCGVTMSSLPTHSAKYMRESNYFIDWATDLDTVHFII